MASVDEVWAEMQRDALREVDLSSLQRERRRPKRAPAKQLDASLHWMQGWSASLKPQTEVGLPTTAVSAATCDNASMRLTDPPTTLIDAVEAIPTETPETFLAYLQRDINCLGEDSLSVRLQSLQKLERVLVKQVDALSTDIVDAVVDALLKPLCKRLKDKSEKCRELSVKILKSLVENASELSAALPYIFPTLVSRLGCEDLDGVAHLPEVMRPSPEQKPTEIARPVEESEEVRLELARFVAALLARCSQTQILSYVDEATGLLRAGAMDPFHEVKSISCETMISFCHNNTEILLHFAEPMGRSLTSCLTHNHAKIRIASLRALTAVLWCGVWKHNSEIMQLLMAWQDPNKAPIKAFYEPVTNINYMSTLSFDRHPAVRRFWFETMAYWLLRIPDKVDHEPYLFPYLLTGLCDDNEEIALETFWLIEKCGELYESEKEEDLRKTRQYGFDYGWTYEGKAFIPFPLRGVWAGGGLAGSVRRSAAHGPDLMGQTSRDSHFLRDGLDGLDDPDAGDLGDEVPLPERDYAWPELRDLQVYKNLPRPRLGSRCWVRTHARRYIKATFNDVVDFRDCTALNAGRLLCMTLAYTEEGVTEWIHPMLSALCKFYSGRAAAAGDAQVIRTYDTVCKLLGSYLDPGSYWQQLRDALHPDSPLGLDQRIASVHILALCIAGSVLVLDSIREDMREHVGLGRLANVIPELVPAMHMSDLLLAPSDSSREVMWELFFSFVEPLKKHLTFAQVSQLLYVALALGGQAPTEASGEFAALTTGHIAAPRYEEEEVADPAKLRRALDMLGSLVASAGSKSKDFSLDEMDDTTPGDLTVHVDPHEAHLELFQKALPEVMERLADSLQVFRSVVYLSPLPVLISAEHADTVIERLVGFCGTSMSPGARASSHALAMHLAHRCALISRHGGKLGEQAKLVIRRLFQEQGRSYLAEWSDVKFISYPVITSGLALWRRFFLSSKMDPCEFLFSAEGSVASSPLQWMTNLLADQELYKKFHVSMERAEVAHSGTEKENFVIAKTRQIRTEAERRALIVRAAAASNVLLVLRLLGQNGSASAPRQSGRREPRALHAVFLTVASLFRTASPTMDPPFVKPTPPAMILYGAEILHTLMHQESCVPVPPFQLRDDAVRVIHHLPRMAAEPKLPLELSAEERETLVSEFVNALMDLNLTLPPDPEAKHTPATLAEGANDEVFLGWDVALEAAACTHPCSGVASLPQNQGAIPGEVARLLAQSEECLRWNAALALYILGVDVSAVCQDGFQRCISRWRKRNEAAKVLVTSDLLQRSARAKGGETS